MKCSARLRSGMVKTRYPILIIFYFLIDFNRQFYLNCHGRPGLCSLPILPILPILSILFSLSKLFIKLIDLTVDNADNYDTMIA